MTARRFIVGLLALLIAVQVVRNAAVWAWADNDPREAASFWPDHPAVQLTLGMTDIAIAARERRPVAGEVFGLINDAATKVPLAPEPFLVRGVQAQLSGHDEVAKGAFAAAQWRDPRSLSAAFFLADYYFRNGDPAQGLPQVAILARLSPNGLQTVAPYVAAYARDHSKWPQLKALFGSQPDLEDPALGALATDANNAPTILALADSSHRTAESGWVQPLLNSLIAAGRYGEARDIWAYVSHVRLAPGTLLYDADFSAAGPPPPFNWQLTSSTIGLAERQPGGRLHVLYYGQDDGVLVRQLLLLASGTYRLSMQVLGDPSRAKALSWSLRCNGSKDSFSSVGLDAIGRGWVVRVPAGCGAQWLELSGTSADMPQQSDITVAGVRLEREAGGA